MCRARAKAVAALIGAPSGPGIGVPASSVARPVASIDPTV